MLTARFLGAAFLLCLLPGAQAQDFELLKIEANSAKGFQWPYYLTVPIPRYLVSPTVLLVLPNNSGTTSDDQAFHDTAARTTANNWAYNVRRLGSPILAPTFPRPASAQLTYTQALDRLTLLTKLPGLERIDLQLIAMIEDARAQLAARGLAIEQKVWMWGFSASGQFVSRFVYLHPEVVKAASANAGGFGPPVPVAEWKGRTLEYPWGVADLEALVGTRFDVDAFRQMPLQFSVGDEDANVMPNWNPAADPEQGMISELFGGGYLFNRWPVYERIYQSVGSHCEFLILPAVAHALAPFQTYMDFFERYRREPVPPPRSKPWLYTLHVPHVACADGWDTEIALTYTLEGAPVQGELRAHNAEGGAALDTLAVTLPPAGRKEVSVCRELPSADSAGYLVFNSDSGFVAGYARFRRGASAVSLGLASPDKTGVLAGAGEPGWSLIGFLNPGAETATVEVTAVDENGSEVSSAKLQVRPGAKVANTAESLFGWAAPAARFFRYTANLKVVGFALHGRADGSALDGLAALPRYLR